MGGLPSDRSSLRAFWSEPRVCVERYEVAWLRVDWLKRLIAPGMWVGHCCIRDSNS